jgi:hypothetical protein
VLAAVPDGISPGDLRHLAVDFDTEFAKYLDAASPAIKGVWPLVKKEAVLLFGSGSPPGFSGLFKDKCAFSASCGKSSGCEARDAASDDYHVIVLLI